MPLASSGNLQATKKGDAIMKKIALVLALAFAFTAKMAVVTVVSHTDQAMADSAGTIVLYPEEASQCNETNC
jgi:predicted lipoprotein with Yx(FWY)xxD motif